ncbi:MAG TPA: monovalent cation/H+ antiporter subunit D family protein [Halanaerobiaceae bacterium]|nr:proton-conducting transporter membrane subunit [Bacillota bacterium]HHU92920.1 monovalent cation/H+ antiporter subunit D family protein [Halanaerobiaceae bacterium]
MTSLILALMSALVGVLLIVLIPGENKKLRNSIVFLSVLLALVFSWRTGLLVFAGKSIGLKVELGRFVWSLRPDPLGVVFGLIASTLWLFTGVYSFGYMDNKEKQGSYYVFFLLALCVTLGVAFAGNLVTLYLFYEFLSFATYPLVIHERSPEAMKSGKKYILYSLSGAGLLLVAIVLTHHLAGNLAFGAGPILEGLSGPGLNWLLLLFALGFGVKAAVMPLHHWLPSAMVAPTPVSALLHAVAVVYSGAYGIVRVVYSVFGRELAGELVFSKIFLYVIVFTILAGIIVAIRQDHLKRRLAYQTISHLSYILLGAFTLTPWGLAGAVFHMISYSTLKITLFFCAGIISELTGKSSISKMKGIGRGLPGTMVLFATGTLGMIGILPLNTFWGKYYLMKGSVAGGMWPLALVLIISGILNGVCFIPFIIKAFSGEKNQPAGKTGKRGYREYALFIPPLVLTIAAISMGLLPGMVWPAVQAVVDWFF